MLLGSLIPPIAGEGAWRWGAVRKQSFIPPSCSVGGARGDWVDWSYEINVEAT